MADNAEPERATTNKPLHGERRPLAPALLGVIGMIVFVVLVVALITWLRYHT